MKKKKNTETCYLVRENELGGKLEYFDIASMKFTELKVKSSNFSTIDAMTTLFDDERDFELYLNPLEENNNSYNYKIMYRYDKKDNYKFYNVIWNDYKLNALSKITEDRVDFSLPIVYGIFDEMISEIRKIGSGFAFSVECSKSNDKRLSDYSKKLIGALASNREALKTEMLIDSFLDYKEMRALYLNYKGYQKRDESYKLQLRKLLGK